VRVIGLCGPSGAGKTTLAEGLIAALKARGQRVSVVKHAHKRFDIDQPGKDSWRHRQAGATEVLVANGQRLALIREFETEVDLQVHELLAELADLGDAHWVLVEGFKHADLLKVEVWREALGAAPMYPHDPFIVAVVSADVLPASTGLPVVPPSTPESLADLLLRDPERFAYQRRG
jgi:molybdopterin-guanine dinucleotide biosynthesis adapter protein